MTAGTAWLLVLLCAAVLVTIRGAGPALTGARQLPPAAVRVVVLLSSALLAALVVTAALADGGEWRVGADTAGVATAGVLLWRRAHVLVAVLAAVLVTAGLRALGVH
ncbi:AzlD domain-containing protein [Geodermatophilus marinus]|uniref:AzlD domain-containing protein n=1 Tax=Geodermatophilus sp. LHW52908 TaxID=2303986 RepID=UPI000E3BA8FA|nr:AzlD domain-containing protein [Geodermatophilus sp. LHW52908]RFU21595.1 AzlD domain-containing protein [Geodermatophilus sp. LHW52908]